MGKTMSLFTNLALFFQLFTIPSNKTLDAIAKLLFPEELYISYIICCVIFKLLKTDHKIFVTRLETFSSKLIKSPILVNYVNRILVLLSHCRIIKQISRLLNSLLDVINCIKKAGCFSPSAMISLETGRQIIVEFALTRIDKMRFIIAYYA